MLAGYFTTDHFNSIMYYVHFPIKKTLITNMYFNLLTPKKDQHLASPHCDTGQSSVNHKVERKKGNGKGFDCVKQILLINTIRNGWITVCGEYTVYPIQVLLGLD